MANKKITIVAMLVLMAATMSSAYGQQNIVLGQDRTRNVITTAVPSLMIGPDSRIGAMGEAGVALLNDINAQHWNPSKYAFMENPFGAGFSFSPWLAGLGCNDIYLAYLAGYARSDKMGAISFSLRYFSMGEMELTDDQGGSLGIVHPNELGIDAGYSRKLLDDFSMAVSFRFIYSDLSRGREGEIKPGMTGAADVAFFYVKDLKANRVESSKISWGLNLSNIGGKISYSTTLYRSFIPTNFRTGIAYELGIDKYNKITFVFDLNKLLVPTPPLYGRDSITNNLVIMGGRTEYADHYMNVSPAEALIKSWYDAPRGFGEEMEEFIQNFGLEYGYNDVFFIRTGFFNEAKTKGNRKYITFGVGLKYSMFAIDAAYILPVNSRNHPLENTLRFSLTFDFFTKNNKTHKKS